MKRGIFLFCFYKINKEIKFGLVFKAKIKMNVCKQLRIEIFLTLFITESFVCFDRSHKKGFLFSIIVIILPLLSVFFLRFYIFAFSLSLSQFFSPDFFFFVLFRLITFLYGLSIVEQCDKRHFIYHI